MKIKIGETISDGFRTYVKGRDHEMHLLPTRGMHATFVVSSETLDKVVARDAH